MGVKLERKILSVALACTWGTAADANAAPEHLRAAEQRLLDAHAMIPLFHYTSKHLLSPALCGYRAHPLDHHPSEFLRFCADTPPP